LINPQDKNTHLKKIEPQPGGLMNKTIMVIFLLICFIHDGHTENIRAATSEWKPYAIRTDNGFKGIAVDILHEIAKRTGDNITINLYPAPRLNKYFDSSKIDINFADSLYWNKITAPPTYIFTDSYLFVKEFVYWRSADNFAIATLKDLYGKTVGITRGYYYSMVEDAFESSLVKKESANSDEILFKKLIRGRNKLIFMDELSFNFLSRKFKYDKQEFKRGLQLTYAPLGIKVRIEKQHLIKRLNNTIDEMRDDDTIRKIVSKYDSMTEY